MKTKTKQEQPYKDKYLIYDRKSTDDVESQKNSLEYQESENIRFAERNGLPIAKVTIAGFCTDGIIREKHSGFKESDDFEINSDGSINHQIDRPKFLTLVRALKNKDFKGVIFLCWDRASRNQQDNVLLKKLEKLGCDIRFSHTNYDKSSSGALHKDIDGMFSEHYSRVISEKVKDAGKKLREDGRCLYYSPLGYLDKGSDNKPFDPERMHLVKRIFELYSTGEWSFRELAKWANEQGLTTKPMRRKRTKKELSEEIDPASIPSLSRSASHSTIENILKNPFYIGKTKNPDGSFSNGKSHTPLIDIGLFNKVQDVLKSRNVSVRYIDKDFFTYRGILRCQCDRAYSPYEQKGIIYYRTRCKDGCTNPDANLTESAIHDLIEEELSKIYFTDEEIQQIEVEAKLGLDKVSEMRNKELDDLHARHKKVFDDLDYITKNRITLLRTNTMSPEELRTEEARLGVELADIESKTKVYSEAAQEMLRFVITFSELIKNASLYYKHALDSEKRDIVTTVFSELTFADRKLISYKAKDGFDALLKRGGDQMGGPIRARTVVGQALHRPLSLF